MDVCNAGSFTLLMDEKFDFDLSFSPKSGQEDDDEVFIGPVGHKEKCVAVGIEIQSHDAEAMASSKPSTQGAWSPLSGEKFVEIFKEARLLALQLGSNSSNEQSKMDKSDKHNSALEEFVQESKAKLEIFQLGQENSDWCTPNKRETYCVPNGPTPSKRETYCVADSPFSLLPSAFQQCLDMDTSLNTQSLAQVQRTPNNASPSSLIQTSNSQTKSISEKKAVCKLQHTKATPMQGNTHQLAKPTPEIKITALKKHLNGLGSSEDVCSEKSSIVSDMSDSSFNSKRALPAPHKLGLNTQLKPPSANGPTRKNTSSSSSSSSSSFSSINSSTSTSPVEGSAKSSNALNTSFSSCRLPSSTSRLGMAKHNIRLSVQSDCSNKSNQLVKALKTSQFSNTIKAAKPASTSLSQTQTPVDKTRRQSSLPGLQRLSMHSKLESSGKGNACQKPKASNIPTPHGPLKAPKQTGAPSPETTALKIMQPERLLSCSSRLSGIIASTPIRPPTHGEPQTPSLSAKSTLVSSSAKRASALPTSLSRRVSGIPTTAPKSFPKAWCSPQLMLPCQASSMSTCKLVASSAQTKETKSQDDSNPALYSDGDAAPPLLAPFTLNFSPEAKVTKSEVHEEATASQSDNEVLLIDFAAAEKPAVLREMENKLLIDLSNTPEVHQNAPQKPTVRQLIDLSSPLINLSPVADKENLKVDSPLLKF